MSVSYSKMIPMTAIPIVGPLIQLGNEKRIQREQIDPNQGFTLKELRARNAGIEDLQKLETCALIGSLFQTIVGVILIQALQWTLVGGIGIALGGLYFIVNSGLLIDRVRWLNETKSQIPSKETAILNTMQQVIRAQYPSWLSRYTAPDGSLRFRKSDLGEKHDLRETLSQMIEFSLPDADDVFRRQERYTYLHNQFQQTGRELRESLWKMDAYGDTALPGSAKRVDIFLIEDPTTKYITGIDQTKKKDASNEGIAKLFEAFDNAQKHFKAFRKAMETYLDFSFTTEAEDNQKIAALKNAESSKAIQSGDRKAN